MKETFEGRVENEIYDLLTQDDIDKFYIYLYDLNGEESSEIKIPNDEEVFRINKKMSLDVLKDKLTDEEYSKFIESLKGHMQRRWLEGFLSEDKENAEDTDIDGNRIIFRFEVRGELASLINSSNISAGDILEKEYNVSEKALSDIEEGIEKYRKELEIMEKKRQKLEEKTYDLDERLYLKLEWEKLLGNDDPFDLKDGQGVRLCSRENEGKTSIILEVVKIEEDGTEVLVDAIGFKSDKRHQKNEEASQAEQRKKQKFFERLVRLAEGDYTKLEWDNLFGDCNTLNLENDQKVRLSLIEFDKGTEINLQIFSVKEDGTEVLVDVRGFKLDKNDR